MQNNEKPERKLFEVALDGWHLALNVHMRILSGIFRILFLFTFCHLRG